MKAKEKLERLEVNLQHVEKLHTSIVKQERGRLFIFIYFYFFFLILFYF